MSMVSSIKSYLSLHFLHILNAQCFIFPIAIQQMVKINRYIKSTLIIQNIYCVTGESSIFKPLAWSRIKDRCPNLSLAKFVMSWTFKHCSSIRKYYILMWLPIRITKKNYPSKILAKEENIARIDKIWQLERFSDWLIYCQFILCCHDAKILQLKHLNTRGYSKNVMLIQINKPKLIWNNVKERKSYNNVIKQIFGSYP